MKPLAQQVAAYIRDQKMLKPGHRTAIAVSGGLDSVALLRLAIEMRSDLGIVLSVVHFNHQLRGKEAEKDEQFVAELALGYGLEFHCQSVNVRRHSLENHLSLEAAARELRYRYFHTLLESSVLDRIATAHTLDDQAETVLLRLARGAGTRGLAGIYPRVTVNGGAIVRPFLQTRREGLKVYVQSLNQEWREDQSNADLRHARNRVRHGILPILERELNPQIREALADTAGLAREEEAYWTQQVVAILPKISPADHILRISDLVVLPTALQRRVVRHAAGSVGLKPELKHVSEILQVAYGEANSAELPGGWSAIRMHDELQFLPSTPVTADYEYNLPVPGMVEVPEAEGRFEALVSIPGEPVSNSNDWLDASLLQRPLKVRNWRPGDRFWPAHSKAPRKVKELLQERKIAGRERKIWPVVASGSEVVWLRGFSSPGNFRPKEPDKLAVAIRESAIE